MKAALLILALAKAAAAQTTVLGDAWVAGALGAGTSTPSARMEVVASSLTQTVFQVSGVDETPFLTVGSSGAVGLGVVPAAGLDVNGSGDSGAVGVQLRGGNLYPAATGLQIAFGYNGTTNLSHAIRTVHSTAAANGSIDFMVWNTAVATTAAAGLEVASLVTTTSTVGGGSLHIRPAGTTPIYELVVSNGVTQGGGTVHRLSEGSLSSRSRKTDISYLGPEDELKAYAEVRGLKHASFRYKAWKKGKLAADPRQPRVRGTIYEDAPASIQGRGKTLVLDEQVINAELALKELMRRLDSLKAEAEKLKP